MEANSVMKNLTSKFWRCDPASYERGVTYEEVTQLLQGYIEGEVDLNHRASCIGKCHEYDQIRTNRCYGEGVSYICTVT